MLDLSTPIIKWPTFNDPNIFSSDVIYVEYKLLTTNPAGTYHDEFSFSVGEFITSNYMILSGFGPTNLNYFTVEGHNVMNFVGAFKQHFLNVISSEEPLLHLYLTQDPNFDIYVDSLGHFCLSSTVLLVAHNNTFLPDVALTELKIVFNFDNPVENFGFETLSLEASEAFPKKKIARGEYMVNNQWVPGCSSMIDTWDREVYQYTEHRMRTGRIRRIQRSSSRPVRRTVEFDMIHAARLFKDRLNSTMSETAGMSPEQDRGTLEHLIDYLLTKDEVYTWPSGLRNTVFLDAYNDHTKPTASQGVGNPPSHFRGPYYMEVNPIDHMESSFELVNDLMVEHYPIRMEFWR